MAEIGVGLVGYKFMGRAHSNAYRQVSHFFDVDPAPRMRAICGREEAATGPHVEEATVPVVDDLPGQEVVIIHVGEINAARAGERFGLAGPKDHPSGVVPDDEKVILQMPHRCRTPCRKRRRAGH